ncbi:hypothetical protein BJV85_000135 [Clostridium acetobutylicum]|uniref:KANL3/Tex30 alpha/beta hydrolase-like domain-containing protein n=1 Tax=Clostridium acetobutylicum (strain ATCC 824 / DSM 792 / JCM 1419 / IAM 19013 / LMG 5710 / NBRC 13948 / NRRL B-527 / VKM B-1787 / 2291 / W) TaxID=272562 RepID=Q97N12_CLOAB|nr:MULTISPECIES: alpha/beta family hydrolase [Clostridium]AAK78013.1 Hypothetical protein CA_C0026 [Clostridium acetobutylicum ATCC 824]ADZ19069.1 Conserved hypothetical protein [Clostridium acetobutylicum EA 2018]AEI31016.1 hypothetical protein SMB_G0026 [Clostridium acetobutylicum DSM 1731]AWV81924.1 alpha/beta hydrolase [Clostridium acetobutylicum]MBC2395474.1 alpha/beta hydrolase [Clostridium acetobutylicum]
MNNKLVRSLKYNDVYGELYSYENSSALTVIFPGINYGHEKPLLYYARKAAAQNNIDILCINYKNKISWEDIGKQSIEDVAIEIKGIIKNVIEKKYDNIYFLGKSVGTEIAGCTSSKLNIDNIKFLYLTPIEETLKYIVDRKCIVVSGTKDEFFKSECINKIRENKNVKLMLFEGANHSLEIKDDIIRSLRILDNVAQLYLDFFK